MELFNKVVSNGVAAKFENQKVVHRIHRHPPYGGIGVFGATFTFAPEYASKIVAMALALESQIETKLLLEKFKTVGAARVCEAYYLRYMQRARLRPEAISQSVETGTEAIISLPNSS